MHGVVVGGFGARGYAVIFCGPDGWDGVGCRDDAMRYERWVWEFALCFFMLLCDFWLSFGSCISRGLVFSA